MIARFFLALTLGVFLLVWPVPGLTQSAEPVLDEEAYTSWNTVATRAEEVLAVERASSLSLEQLRAQLADWRSRFQSGQDINAERIETLEGQIAALGPVPEDGTTEASEIAERRTALNAQLATLRVPGRRAIEAFTRADGLIRQIDRVIRERQANALLDLKPSPLIPGNWVEPLENLGAVTDATLEETKTAWAAPTQRAAFRAALPKVLIFTLVGFVLILRGRAWSLTIARRLLRNPHDQASSVLLSMLVSLGQMILPILGLLALREALYATGFVGLTGNAILSQLLLMGAALFGARWLGSQIFARLDGVPTPLNLPAGARSRGRVYANGIGAMLVGLILLTELVRLNRIPQDSADLLQFPLVAIMGLLLFWIGRLILQHTKTERQGQDETRFTDRIFLLLGRAALLFGAIGPVLGAIGYARAAEYFVLSPVLSLGLLSTVWLLQSVSRQLFNFFSGRAPDQGEGLISVLVSFGLLILAMPAFALIWGARIADLTELWSQFLAGYTLGETRISPADFLTFVVIFVIGYTLTRLVQGAMRTSVLPKTKIDHGGQNAIVSGLGYLGIFLAALIAISSAGIDLSSLAIVAGALSVGIGFGLQNIVSNFVSGIILLIERPVSEGDWIEVGGVHGTVRRISVRSTRIETFDRSDVILPNADLISGAVTNYTRGNQTGRIILKIGVAYGNDSARVAEILREVAESHPLVILVPPPAVLFADFGADSLDFEIRAILRDVNFGLTVKSEMRHTISKRFEEEGIEIPFTQRDIWLRNPEALVGGAKAPAPMPAPPQEPKEDET